MTGFVFTTVPRLKVGPGTAQALGTEARDLGLRRPLLVTDAGLVQLGLIAPIETELALSLIHI